GVLLLNSCERGRTNKIERNCQLGFRSIVTWGIGGRGGYCLGECRINMIGPSTFDFGIFAEIDFDQ
nr:hypothetical protein [Tanacetum cinerariifolium]